jgi:hypothetical protein
MSRAVHYLAEIQYLKEQGERKWERERERTFSPFHFLAPNTLNWGSELINIQSVSII